MYILENDYKHKIRFMLINSARNHFIHNLIKIYTQPKLVSWFFLKPEHTKIVRDERFEFLAVEMEIFAEEFPDDLFEVGKMLVIMAV